MANIRNGSGVAAKLNGTSYLDNGHQGGATTATDDAGDTDGLTGGDGRDWFFTSLVNDNVNGQASNEFLDELF